MRALFLYGIVFFAGISCAFGGNEEDTKIDITEPNAIQVDDDKWINSDVVVKTLKPGDFDVPITDQVPTDFDIPVHHVPRYFDVRKHNLPRYFGVRKHNVPADFDIPMHNVPTDFDLLIRTVPTDFYIPRHNRPADFNFKPALDDFNEMKNIIASLEIDRNKIASLKLDKDYPRIEYGQKSGWRIVGILSAIFVLFYYGYALCVFLMRHSRKYCCEKKKPEVDSIPKVVIVAIPNNSSSIPYDTLNNPSPDN